MSLRPALGTAARPHLGPWLAVIAAVLLANAAYLLHLVDPDPAHQLSRLALRPPQGLLRGLPTIDPNAGFTAQALGHRAAVDLLHGRAPWWNPYEGLGTPLAGSMQPAAFFPLTPLFAVPGGVPWFYALLEVVSGLATYHLLRRLGVRPVFAVAGGIAFALCGTTAWFRYSAVNPLPFLPLLVLGVERARDAARAQRRGGHVLVAVAVALSLYAGFPETALLDGLLGLCWLAWRLGAERRGRVRLAGKAALGGAAGLLLAAPLLVPFAGYLGTAFTGAHQGDGFRGAHLPGSSWPSLVLPYLFGPIFFPDPNGALPGFWAGVGGYASLALVLLALVALVGVVHGPHRGLRVVLAGWVVLALGRTYGVPGLAGLVDGLPGAGVVAIFRYAPPSWEFALVVLAALGLEDAASGRLARRWSVPAGLAGMATVAGAAAYARPMIRAAGGGLTLLQAARLSVGWGALAVLLVVVGLLLARRRGGRLLLAGVVVVDALGLFVVPQLSAPRNVTVDHATIAFLQANTGTGRVFSFGPLRPNYGSYWGIPQLNTNEALVPGPFDEVVRDRLDPAVNPLNFLGTVEGRPPDAPAPAEVFRKRVADYRDVGVAFVLTEPGQPAPAPGLDLAYRGAAAWVWAVDHPVPYAEASGCSVRVLTRTRLTTDCARPAVLLRRELVSAGWTASVAGRSAPVVSDGLFQRVQVPAGTSSVRFSYAPPHLEAALVAGALGVALLLVPLVRRRPAAAGRSSRTMPIPAAASASVSPGGAYAKRTTERPGGRSTS